MEVAEILQTYHRYQVAFYVFVLLQLTGYMFPPPANLKDGDTFDYIIIGAGTGGCNLAAKLAKMEYNILLIEAGPDAPYETTLPKLMPYVYDSHTDWNYTTVNNSFCYSCQINHVTDLNPGKMYGGTGGINFLIYSRGNADHINYWYEVTKDPTWKIQNVIKYFIKSENVSDSEIRNSRFSPYFGSKGPIGVTRNDDNSTNEVLKGFEQIGEKIIPDLDGNRKGYGKALLTILNGMRENAGPTCLSNVTENKYIATAKKTLATKIVFDKNNQAIGVEVITDKGNKAFIKIRKEVIVACGALKSPQLLKLSGIGPKRELEKFNITTISDLPVGKTLLDIPALFIAHKTNMPNRNRIRGNGEYPWGLIVGYASRYGNQSYDEPPDYMANVFVTDDNTTLVYLCSVLNKFRPDICEKLLKEADDNRVIITLLGNLYGESSGQVTLRSTNPKDPPYIQSPDCSFQQDIDDMISNMKHYLLVENSPAWKDIGATRIDLSSSHCADYKKNSREYWRCTILCMMVSLKSWTGTCPLGSVVDSRLNIRGVSKARVVDASVIPNKIGGMINDAVWVVSDIGGDMIIKDAGKEYNSMQHEMIKPSEIENLPDDRIEE